MKHQSLLLVILFSLLAVCCVKEGDFDALRHPIVVEGEFDPQLGMPLATMSAEMSEMLAWFDTSMNVTLEVGDDGQMTLHYSEVQHSVFEFSMTKHTKAASADTISQHRVLRGIMPVALFEKLGAMVDRGVSTQAVYVTMDALLKGYVNDMLLAEVNNGTTLYFDSITLEIACEDGYQQAVPIADEATRFSVHELMAGRQVTVLQHYDCHNILAHKPQSVAYAIRMNMEMPVDRAAELTRNGTIDSLGVDSIAATFETLVDFPLRLNCQDIRFNDTIPLALHQLDSLLNAAEDYLTLNDSMSYLVIEAKNYIPLNFGVNSQLLDASQIALVQHLLPSDSLLVGAPIKHVEGQNEWVADGCAVSRIVLPIDMPMLHNLAQSKYINFAITTSTSAPNSDASRPIVTMNGHDKLELRAYLVVAPHLQLSIPVSKPHNS